MAGVWWGSQSVTGPRHLPRALRSDPALPPSWGGGWKKKHIGPAEDYEKNPRRRQVEENEFWRPLHRGQSPKTRLATICILMHQVSPHRTGWPRGRPQKALPSPPPPPGRSTKERSSTPPTVKKNGWRKFGGYKPQQQSFCSAFFVFSSVIKNFIFVEFCKK